MDGVLWRGETALPGLRDLFETLTSLRLPFVLATNSAARTPDEYCLKLSGFGVHIDPAHVVTSALSAADDLASRLAPASQIYVIGEPALRQALLDRTFVICSDSSTDVKAVVVGFDHEFNYAKLRDASLLIRRGADFVATNLDDVFPVEGALMPGAGALVAAVVTASGRQPRVTGKPGRPMFDWALRTLALPAGETLMVGDRMDTDIAGGAMAGMLTALVTTGVNRSGDDIGLANEPDIVVDGLPALSDWLRSAARSQV